MPIRDADRRVKKEVGRVHLESRNDWQVDGAGGGYLGRVCLHREEKEVQDGGCAEGKESQESEKEGSGKKTARLRCPGSRFQSGGREWPALLVRAGGLSTVGAEKWPLDLATWPRDRWCLDKIDGEGSWDEVNWGEKCTVREGQISPSRHLLWRWVKQWDVPRGAFRTKQRHLYFAWMDMI